MKLTFSPYTLELKHVFTVARNSRTTTPIMLTQIEHEGIIGYGEASMPPYLGESQESVTKFLSKVDLSKYKNPFELETILDDIDKIAPGNGAAKASVDIALHDLVGKMMNQPWYNIWGYDKEKAPYTSFTIGIDKPDVIRKKVEEAKEFKILKVKLGRDNDKEMIEVIRSVSNQPISVDANQGWSDKNYALEMIEWLNERNILFVEQPMPKEQIDDTGMREANKMITLARALGLKVMLGCMTETSCAISAASHLSPMVDWADLDGALLISNDIFKGTMIENGKVNISSLPGIGITKM
jgi:L-alanine-DL-glutamate epimerase-like enolase superfamily enzyme